MALYALGDLHLGFQRGRSMDAFGKVWKNHEKKIEKYVNRTVALVLEITSQVRGEMAL